MAAANKVFIDAEKAKVVVEAIRVEVERAHATKRDEANVNAVAEYQASEGFIALVDKEVMDQCDDLVYQFK